jgi:hypothetical protein
VNGCVFTLRVATQMSVGPPALRAKKIASSSSVTTGLPTASPPETSALTIEYVAPMRSARKISRPPMPLGSIVK